MISGTIGTQSYSYTDCLMVFRSREMRYLMLLGAGGLGLWKLKRYMSRFTIKNATLHAGGMPRQEHDERRYRTYPALVPNTWYCIGDEIDFESDQTKVIEVRAMHQTFALWKSSTGDYVCQDAFCLHLGANLAVGGHRTKDDCLRCPFHAWEFDKAGCIVKIPSSSSPHTCPSKPKLKTYPCRAWLGSIFVYFHADGAEPDWELSTVLEKQLRDEKWKKDHKWDIGHVTLTVPDWVDQAGDHSHFEHLHGEFLLPWTTLPIPEWVYRFFPLAISHKLETFKGDDPAWAKLRKEKFGDKLGHLGKHNLYLVDNAALTWNGGILDSSSSQTLVEFFGPANMVFDIPFTIGTFKVCVFTTPVEGGSVMRVRTFIDKRTWRNPLVYAICWVLSGISASQLQSDIDILTNKIRLRKPMTQRYDGPWGRVNGWLKQFYSEGSDSVGQASYCPDW